MAGRLRVEYEGRAIYHVMNRGNRREPIIKSDQDRVAFPAGDGHHVEMDCGSVKNGDVDPCSEPALQCKK